jgi:hypothetical protein
VYLSVYVEALNTTYQLPLTTYHSLIPHPHCLRPFFLLVFFLIEPGVVVFGFDHGSGAGGVLATGGNNKKYEENVYGQFSHALIRAKIVLFGFMDGDCKLQALPFKRFAGTNRVDQGCKLNSSIVCSYWAET